MYHPVLWAAFGTGITCLSTVLGSATVLFVRGKTTPTLQRMFLGFAAGVMVAASVFSLLLPAIEEAEAAGGVGWLPAAGGFILGVLFLWGLDSLLPHLHPESDAPEGLPSSWRRTTLMVLAVTLHNIPEGMAVGLSFALAAQSDGGSLSAAMALAVGIGLQNFPEGAVISMPLRATGMKKSRAFVCGALSGIVEPAAAFLTILAAGLVIPALPYLLSFAAGAMLYVVVEELIPEMSQGEHSNVGTVSFGVGFSLMMALDVALG